MIEKRLERKSCEGCGYTREVEVVYMGVPTPVPCWDRYCAVCVLRGRIATQRRQFEKNEARVRALLERRAKGEETE